MYDDEFELTFDMAEDNAETVKLPGKPLQPAPEAPEAPEPAEKAKEPEVPDFPDDEPTGSRGRCPNRSGNLCRQSLCRSWPRRK